jgi:putative copper export protein/mono/diheme cytochrome c family protein
MDGANPALALLRGLHAAALLSVFGTLLFAELVAPASIRGRLHRHARIGAIAAAVLGLGWFSVQASVFADGGDLASAMSATLFDTRFGHVMGGRLLLLAAIPFAGRRVGLLCAGLALSAQGMLGHAGAAGGNEALGLIVAEALHLLAAGAWLGALVPLLLCLRTQPPHEARLVAERFSPIGMAAVLTIAATALIQALALIGGLPGLIGTAYGRTAMVKLALFLAMLGFAVWNRLSLTDRLDAADPAPARRLLFVSVAVETGCGLAIVLTAGLLASLVPAMHRAPDWPFAWRPSLEAMQDPDLRREVALALLAIGAGLGAVAVSWFFRRWRPIALASAVLLAIWQAPSFGLLSVAAYPTSYLTSPTGFSAASILRGRTVYAAHCAACHGATGQGDGPAVAGSRIGSADLTANHLWDHLDGELFWWVGNGMPAPDGSQAMPGFAATLTAEDRWATIDFAKALNAGAAMNLSGSWTRPVPAPDLPIACDGPQADRLSDLRGGFVRVVTGGGAPSGAATVLRLDGIVPPGGCTAAFAGAREAFAILVGMPADGFEFMIDPAGWLRGARAPNQGPDWNDAAVLSAALRTLREQPISGALGGIHVHGQ